MRTLLFYDTETTGLPKDWKKPSSDFENWPRMVELGFALVREEMGVCTMLMSNSLLIRPEGKFTIPAEAQATHGITTEQAEDGGVPLRLALDIFEDLQLHADFLVAHNASFDGKIVRASEAYLGSSETELTKAPTICTMMTSTKWCNLPGKRGPKWPKLEELYGICFNGETFNAHRAGDDCQATAKCFSYLMSQGVINDETFQKAIDKKAQIDEAVRAKKAREAML